MCLIEWKPRKQAPGRHTVLASLTPRLTLLMGPPGRHCVAAKRGISRNGTCQCVGIVLHGDT
jgi:hypothetical protein